MVENIIDISVLKAEIPGKTPALSLSSYLYKPTRPFIEVTAVPSKYFFTFPEGGDLRSVREDT